MISQSRHRRVGSTAWRQFLLRTVVLCVVSLAAGLSVAHAEDWPSRRIVLIVPYPPGATSDLVGRVLADAIGTATGQTVIVDNRPGAGGILGSSYAAKAQADGYTLLLGNNATHVIQPLVSRNVHYDPVQDFTPVALVADADEFVGINADLPVKNMAELITLAKSEPGKLNYGSAGIGSFGQFATELLKLQAGIDLLHVPYRGSQAALIDLTAGRIQIMFDPTVVAHRDGGHIRLLASSGADRFPGTPDLPTMVESGLPDYRLVGWFGLFAPKGLPPDIAMRLSDIAAKALLDPKVQTTMLNAGLTPRGLPSAALAARLASDATLYADIKTRAHIPEVE